MAKRNYLPKPPIKIDFNVRDDLKDFSVEDVQKIQKESTLPYAVAGMNLNGDLNLGVCMRSAVIFGARDFFILGRRRYDRRSDVGSPNYIDVHHIEFDDEHHPDSPELVKSSLLSHGYYPVFVETSGQDISKMDLTTLQEDGLMPCFIFGNEGYGIPDIYLKDAMVVRIHQIGVMRSLNVSSACAIICHRYSDAIAENKS